MLDSSGIQKGLQQANGYLKTFSDSTATVQDKMTALGGAMSKAGGLLTTSLTLPILGLGTAAVNLGNEFEAQMSRVQGTLQATDEDMEKLNEQALQLGADTSFSASQAAEGMENLASAGFTTSEIMAAMPGLLDLAASSGAELGRASEIAASAIRGFGLDAADAGHVADVFAKAAAATNAQVEDMGEAMKYIAPVAKAMGQELEMVSAAIGIMSDAGIKGSQAGTSLRGALSRLARPTDAMIGTMKEFGLSFYDAGGNMLSLVDIVKQLENGLGDVTQEQRNNALVTLFGQESLSGLLALMERGSGELQNLTEEFKNADGAAKDMATTMLDNTAGGIEQMFGSLETLGIKIQQVLAPTIQSVTGWLTELINSISSMSDEALVVTVTIAGIVAALGPLLLIGGKIMSFMATVGPMLAATNTSLLAIVGPIGAVIAAVAALAAAWATNFGGIRDATQEVISEISEVISFGLELISEAWETDFAGIRTITTMAWEAIEDIFSKALDVIVNAVKAFSALLQGDWSGLWEAIKALAQSAWDLICSLIGNSLGLIISLIANAAVGLSDAAVRLFQGLYDAWINLWDNTLKPIIFGTPEELFNMLINGAHWLYDAGVNLFNSLWDGLKSVFEDIKNWVTDSLDWITGRSKEANDAADDLNRAARAGSDLGRVAGSYSSGLDYVPRDMTVRVHEGERILTREENKNRKTAPAVINLNVHFTQPIDETTARKVSKQISRDTEAALRSKGVVLV